ncbi:hypothetical protein ACIG5E_34185 [Kitasatospora sp. NPDC053057]|uniref:hypothetical protein n=1 Tax=Kitasatospora sp. NPDC053057 TaxID=3364062 RepID=UPI0037C769F9
MAKTARICHYTPAEVAELAAAEHPVMVQLVTGQPGRWTSTGAALTGTMTTPAAMLNPAHVAAPAVEGLLAAEVTVAAELAQASVRPIMPAIADPYRPRRGEAAVRLVGHIVGVGRRVTARLEFSDTSKRGPERRRLAVSLAAYYDVEFERVVTWHHRDIDTGYAYDEQGRMHGTSRREEYAKHSHGHGRTDARVWGEAEAVAKFCAVLPIVLEEIDRLSLAWGKRVSAWLTSPAGEHYTTPRERRGTVAKARREFAETLAHCLGRHGSPAGVREEVDPGRSLPYQARSAAIEKFEEIGGSEWLEQWQRPQTEAVYERCAALAGHLAAHIQEERTKAAAAAERDRIEQRVAAEAAAAAEIAAQDAAHRTIVLTEEEMAQLDTAAAHVEPAETEEPATDHRELPLTEPAHQVEPVAETAADLRAKAAILQQLDAPSAAALLLARAEELEAAELAEHQADQDQPADEADPIEARVDQPLSTDGTGARTRRPLRKSTARPRRPWRRPSDGADLFPGAEAARLDNAPQSLDHVPVHPGRGTVADRHTASTGTGTPSGRPGRLLRLTLAA